MHASNKKSAVAQGFDRSTFERAEVVFALSFLAARSVGSVAHTPFRVDDDRRHVSARGRDADKAWGL
jgi:hypothetical protein